MYSTARRIMVSNDEGRENIHDLRESIAVKVESDLYDPTLATAIRGVTDPGDIDAIALIDNRFQDHLERYWELMLVDEEEDGMASGRYTLARAMRTDFENYLLKLAQKY
jgi:hypothetical protein